MRTPYFGHPGERMKSIRLMSALALALLPVVASAQGGGRYGGMGRGRGGRGAGRDSSMRAPALTSDEIMKDSPLRALLDKRKELALTDTQQLQLVNMQGALDIALSPLF